MHYWHALYHFGGNELSPSQARTCNGSRWKFKQKLRINPASWAISRKVIGPLLTSCKARARIAALVDFEWTLPEGITNGGLAKVNVLPTCRHNLDLPDTTCWASHAPLSYYAFLVVKNSQTLLRQMGKAILGWEARVYLSTTLVPVLSLHFPRTQAPDIPAEAIYPPSRH